jgi:hypothetical protein
MGMAEVMTGDQVVIAGARRDLRRVGIGVLCGAMVVLGARLLWGWHWSNETANAEAQFAVSGIPEGIEKVPVPKGATKEAAQDLVALLNAVADHPLAEDQPRYNFRYTNANWPARADDIEFNRPYLKGHSKVLSGLLNLASQPQPDWTDLRVKVLGGRPGSPNGTFTQSHVLRRASSGLLSLAAFEAAHDRDIAGFMRTRTAQEELVRRYASLGNLVPALIVIAGSELSARADLASIPAWEGAPKPSSEDIALIRQRIATLLGPTDLEEVLSPILVDEAEMQRTIQREASWWLLAPAWDGARVIGLRSILGMAGQIAAIEGRGLAAGELPVSARDAGLGNLNPLGGIGKGRIIENLERCQTSRRVAATAWAIRLYRWDHRDRWPTTLGELVPEYLAAVPCGAGEWAGQLEISMQEGGKRPMIKTAGKDDAPLTFSQGPMANWEAGLRYTFKVGWTDLGPRASPDMPDSR